MTAVAFVTQAAPGKSKGSSGWEPSADHLESVVVSIKSSPLTEERTENGWVVGIVDEATTEAACVAVQIAKNLLASQVPAAVTPADEVSIFLTLGGVRIVGADMPYYECDPPVIDADNDPGTPCDNIPGNAPEDVPYCGDKSLIGHLDDFVNKGGEVFICPLCWFGCFDEGDPWLYGDIADGVDIHDLFLYADKVIDF